MTRIPQPAGTRGSLKWIQRAVACHQTELEAPILECTAGAAIDWRSPLATDDFAEYRDAAFLDKIGLPHLAAPLADFWPPRGPQWDALGVTNNGSVLLVEAKAHIGEMCSPGTQASPEPRARIVACLDAVARSLGARADRATWSNHFYQLANRIAHLSFLREQGVSAWLVLANFVGDEERGGPGTAAEWQVAYQVAWHVMGLPARHRLARWIVEVFPPVAILETGGTQS